MADDRPTGSSWEFHWGDSSFDDTAEGAARHAASILVADPARTAAASVVAVGKVYRTATEQVNALVDVSKTFPRGRITAIAGPSGSGKSSLLRILACVDRPTSGSVLIEGRDVAALRVRQRRALRRSSVSYMFQNPIDNLVDYLPAREQVKLASRLRGIRTSTDEIERLLRVLGLDHRLSHTPHQLSGGEQQRLAVACAVIGHPAIVIADEPTAELDSAAADRVLEAFRDLRAEGV
ncbi:MAG: ABC transporter ATP-binding protein, partial [Geodermatophilaceae bacterium]